MTMMDHHMSPMASAHMGMHTPNSVPQPPNPMTSMGPQGPPPMGLSPVSCGPPAMMQHSNTPPGHPQMAGQVGPPLMSMAPGPSGYHHPVVTTHHMMPHGQGPGPGPGQYHMVPSGPPGGHPGPMPGGHPGPMPGGHPGPMPPGGHPGHPGPHPGSHPGSHPGGHPSGHPGPHPGHPGHPGPHAGHPGHPHMHLPPYGPGGPQPGPPPPHPNAVRMPHVEYAPHQRCMGPSGPPPPPPPPPGNAMMPMNSVPGQGPVPQPQQPAPPPHSQAQAPPQQPPQQQTAPPPPPPPPSIASAVPAPHLGPPMPAGAFACAKCKETLSECEQPVQCEAYCRQFYHRYCSGLTAEAIYLLQSEPYIEWLCTGCERTLGPSGIPWVKRSIPY